MALSPYSSGDADAGREGCDVRLIGEDWTMTELLRSLGELAKRLTLEMRDFNDGTHMIASGSPEAVLAAVVLMPVVGMDRDRVIRRLLPLTTFTYSDLKKFRNQTLL
jgi:hypothetical protein